MPSLRLRDLSLSAATAGFVAVLVGFTGSVAIVFQAALSLGATPAEVSSWIWALGLGMGLTTLVISLWLKKPVLIAWCTPGAALLAAAGASGHFGMADAVGAFVVSGALITLCGVTGWFERVMGRIPQSIAAALLAGVLARFAIDAFLALQSAFGLVLLMLAAYLAAQRLWPRYAVVTVLAVGTAYAAAGGQLHVGALDGGLTRPVFVAPVFSWQATVGMALPLFVVTMASQNLPGVAVIRAAGYALPVSRIITATGVVTVLLAPFGAFAFNLAAITAAICMGPEAHEDPARRYVAGAVNGVLYCVIGLFGAAVTGVLTAFPRELVVALAGLALLGSIGGGLVAAVRHEREREAALITFLVTLSGVSLAGVGSAFWGVVAGAAALFVQQWRPRRQPEAPTR
jgi:benzoate membrane transport protein